MRCIIVECTRKETYKSVNGPMVKVTLTPTGPVGGGSETGEIVLIVHDVDDQRAYDVGRNFRLRPEPC